MKVVSLAAALLLVCVLPVQSEPSLVVQARYDLGKTAHEIGLRRTTLWCAEFMNKVLERAGFKGTGSDRADSFAKYGHRIPGPRVGAIAVMSRGKSGGHVGVVSGITKNGILVVSGNHDHRVAEGLYPRGRIYAYVVPQ